MSEPSVIETPVLPDFTNLINVADDRLGAKALFASDEFFAVKERILNAEPAVFISANMMTMANGWTVGRPVVNAI